MEDKFLVIDPNGKTRGPYSRVEIRNFCALHQVSESGYAQNISNGSVVQISVLLGSVDIIQDSTGKRVHQSSSRSVQGHVQGAVQGSVSQGTAQGVAQNVGNGLGQGGTQRHGGLTASQGAPPLVSGSYHSSTQMVPPTSSASSAASSPSSKPMDVGMMLLAVLFIVLCIAGLVFVLYSVTQGGLPRRIEGVYLNSSLAVGFDANGGACIGALVTDDSSLNYLNSSGRSEYGSCKLNIDGKEIVFIGPYGDEKDKIRTYSLWGDHVRMEADKGSVFIEGYLQSSDARIELKHANDKGTEMFYKDWFHLHRNT